MTEQTTIDQLLDHKIRYGTEPDNPTLLALWFDVQQCDSPELGQQRAHFEQQFFLLLEVVVDELVPSQWRRVCLDNIYRPLCNLNRLACCHGARERIRALVNELNVSSHYVSASLNA